MNRLLNAATLMVFSGTAAGQAVTWDGDCGTFWLAQCGPGNTTTSWDNDMFPGPTDDVVINGATVSMNTNEDVNTFSINGGGLTIGGARILTMNNGGTATNTTLAGRFKTFATFSFTGDNAVNAELYGPGQFTNSGTIDVPGLVVGDSLGTPTVFQNDGTCNATFTTDVRAMSEFVNNGTLNTGGGQLTGAGAFTNNGDLIVPQPINAVVGFEDFRQTGGAVTVENSSIFFRSGGRYSGGTMTSNAGGTIQFDGIGIDHRFEGLSELNGIGNVNIATGGFSTQYFDAPITFNMTGEGRVRLNGTAFADATITNSGSTQFAGQRFVQAGAGSFVNEAGADIEVILNSAGQLQTDIPIINRGRVRQFSTIGVTTVGVNPTLTNETGAEWEMVSLPSSGIFFNNSGTVYRRAVDNVAPGNGTIPGIYSQTNGLTRLEAASTTFAGSGTWTDSELEVLDASQATFNANSGPVSFDGDNTIMYSGVDDVVRVTVGANTEFAVGGTLRFSGVSMGPFPGGTIPVNVRGTILGEGEVINEGDMSLNGSWRLGGTIGGGTFRNEGGLLLESSITPSPQITMDIVNTGIAAQFDDIDVEVGAIDNQGQWQLVGSATLDGPTTFTNTGELLAAGGTTFEEIGPLMTLDNQGTVRVAFIQTTLTLHGPVVQLVNGALTGGTWIVEPSCRLVFPAGTVLNTIGPGATVAGATDDIPDIESVDTVEGTLDGRGPLRVFGGLDIENGGEIIVRPPEGIFDSIQVPDEFRNNSFGGGGLGPAIHSTLTLTNTRADGTVVPDACTSPITINASSFINEDLIDVGPAGEIVAAIIDAPVTLASTSLIRCDIAGPAPCTEHDQLHSTGTLTTGGTFEVVFDASFTPQEGDSFDLITTDGSVSGAVPSLTSTGLPQGLRAGLTLESNAVRLSILCSADTNNDGMLTPTDFTAWINAFNNNLPECDQNGDNACTPTDFTAWIANFNAGC
ncbi:MAG: hypothetical protein Phyf2KO_00020 [Phycisphaerales bacterium]